MTDQPQPDNGKPPSDRWCCSGNAEDCRLCDTADLPYPWICPGHPDTPENRQRMEEPTREQRLADQLSREYEYQGIAELEKEDPERAQEHRDAAAMLVKWIAECPREELRAAFGRGFDKGKERQKARTAADTQRLKDQVAELRQDRDPDGLRSRIRDLEYALAGWDRFMTGRLRAGMAPDWQQQAAEYLAKLTEVQRELAVLKGVQPSTATGHGPS